MGIQIATGIQTSQGWKEVGEELSSNVVRMVTLNSCVFEVTRRCNMTCEHCLRGDAENLDMDPVLIDLLVSQVTDINSVTFSGGEPFLNPAPIVRFLERLRTNSLEYFGWFYVATNGSIFCREALDALEEIAEYSDEIAACRVELSNDDWHDASRVDRRLIRWAEDTGLFSKRPFLKEEFVKARGRAALNGMGKRTDPTIEITGYEFDEESGCLNITDDDIYIAATGDVLVDCDLPFDQMEYYKIGNILEKPLIEILIDGIPDCELVSGLPEAKRKYLGYK